jgi:hypothetical protein
MATTRSASFPATRASQKRASSTATVLFSRSPFLTGTEKASPEFGEFLDILGDKKRLKGFEGFRGGLDVASEFLVPSVLLISIYFRSSSHAVDLTGEFSVATAFEGKHVMFHVSTMLPYDAGGIQQVLTSPTRIFLSPQPISFSLRLHPSSLSHSNHFSDFPFNRL